MADWEGWEVMAAQATDMMQTLRERIRGTWAVIDDTDIERSGGSMDKLIETIARKTGVSRGDVRKELRRLLAA